MKDEFRTFNTLAELNEVFIGAVQELQKKQDGTKVTCDLDVRRLNDGCIIDAYLESEQDEEVSLCWWLDATIESKGWSIRTKILKDSSTGQKVLHEFPSQNGQAMEELLDGLKTSVHQLADSALSFKFDGWKGAV